MYKSNSSYHKNAYATIKYQTFFIFLKNLRKKYFLRTIKPNQNFGGEDHARPTRRYADDGTRRRRMAKGSETIDLSSRARHYGRSAGSRGTEMGSANRAFV